MKKEEVKVFAEEHGYDAEKLIDKIRQEVKRCGTSWQSVSLHHGNGETEHTASGYRKYTTGEYVPNSYRDKFGWKNTYYQSASLVIFCGDCVK